jgi:hypothetical protein
MRPSKGVLGLSIAAALGVGVTSVAATAVASSEIAVKAKRCRVHGVPVIKKSCKKPVSRVRATLTWSGGDFGTDYDLYVFGSRGTSTTSTPNGNGITKSKITQSDLAPSGTETFTDLLWRKPGARSFRFGVCHQDGPIPVTYTINYVTTDGRHHTDSQTGGEGFNAVYGNGGGAPALGTMVCPAL